MNFIPALRLRTRCSFNSFILFFGVLCICMAALVTGLFSFGESFNGTISATVITMVMFFFVLGICTPREDMRLLIQFGLSRRTSFLSRLCSAALLAFVTAVAAQLLFLLTRAIAPANVEVIDLYNIIFMQEELESGAAMTFADHIRAVLMTTALTLSCYEFGEFFSLLFFRLNKTGCIIAGILTGLLPGVILPLLLSIPAVYDAVTPAMVSLFKWMGASVFNFIAATLIWTAVILLINYLLMRRAPIKAAAK